MDRRTLLSLVAAGVTGGAGCGTPEVETVTPTPEAETQPPTATRTRTPESRVERTLTIWNPTPMPVFTTVVGTRNDRDVFFENRDLLAGERTMATVAVPLGDTEVLVETDTGVRARSTWTVETHFDGFAVVLGLETTAFWHTVSCDPRGECALGASSNSDIESAVELPLVGDGLSRWYAPAGVVVENSGPKTTARLRIDFRDTVLVDRRYRLPARTQLTVPVTYRTGTYRVVVETDERTVDTTWSVPDEPTKYIDSTSGKTGCGPANTTLMVDNRDDEPHRLRLRVNSKGNVFDRVDSTGEVFDRVLDLGPDETRELVPVATSGSYHVTATLETGAEVSGTWWSCPPRGPASVVVDATGSPSLTAAGPQPG
ncbi:hypothetical protein E6P09_00470 [Haloferax mediterranei ATCC 33500]|uniref:Ig-like domain-containing protein n=1 Tax=Haloferax mediterranei (strain ATCC 33500 / DSM 1411 / JCM 8866 / NBRC 14739 / NCIMB 2177 / R-4) TaxID=523841 RepID=I3R6S1_HALMT|nr:hypothetical protein [Haloferax mediterranei]AFK19931.1 hypothetical protein HFX_2243 [Haloferax mediterranei ATCC 33500]AHZ23309.1 hypothetical protein BM92_11965 [Haloferax mediterranei ATCC 33500]ELZ99475.1 hypothetical protein C439_13014 [Haloferax mediterranei ATCC 33500]MDX5987318.1 hypothetical protein [Haloferax mediterranei ATCC 33500]QCQ73833.1 hypothetical protein E6P09_00470 [Haloferax mediterranei ATCC 33500]